MSIQQSRNLVAYLIFPVSLLLVSVVLFPHHSWAFSAVAKLDPQNCTGTVTLPGHEGEIALRGFDHGVLINPNGMLEVQPFKVVKDFDSCSPELFRNWFVQRFLASVQITIVDDLGQDVLRITLGNATVVSTTTSADSTATRELVGFTFTRIELADLISGTVVSCDFATRKC